MKFPHFEVLTVKNIAEIVALISVAGYFFYQNAAGWKEVSMSLDVTTKRVHDPCDKDKDIIAVVVKLKNGNTGAIRISDAIAAIKYDKITIVNTLEGIVRYQIENGKVVQGKQCPEKLWTGLGPNEEILLSTYASVPTDAVCIVDVTVLAKRKLRTYLSEGRSATISLPIN